MDRPARKTKSINYCEARDIDDNDEDFACTKPPLGKKPKKASSQETSRKALDEKLLTRDLQAAISLSLLSNTNTKTPPHASQGDENVNPASLHRSNCSVDSSLLGLDEISSSSPTSVKKDYKRLAHDDDYFPKLTPESESEEAYSDDEFTVKKRRQKKESHQRKPNKKEREPPKLKAQPKTVSPAAMPRSPPTLKPAVSKPPAGRIPKWTPPGQIGKSPPPTHSPTTGSTRSPAGQGLRLGLSRRVRVKSLHPGNAAT
ncbi:RAD51-associated protein 1 [Corythoichthys intestinalis]|uniref:RAD51-associated protein 1 n=1 Tax=Corythoichthys intestinalis TaxID=161448 RepID=UPI0025A62424|nr:RAD51-associated protein 1 [Corythoichthys intestinalis]